MFLFPATTTDVGSARIAGKDAEVNQLEATYRLALPRFQDRAKLVAVAERMAVGHVDARDHLDDVAPAACNPNVEAGAIWETQSKKNSTHRSCATKRKTTVSRARRCSSRLSLCNPMIEMLWRRRGYGSGITLDEHYFHANGTFHIVVKLRRPRILRRRRAWQPSEPTLKGDRCSRSGNQLSWRSLLKTRRG